MQATLERIDHPTDHIATFWFRPSEPLRFIAGQFIGLRLSQTHDNHRWFTISSAPNDATVSITTKLCGVHTEFKRHLAALQPGDIVTLSEPMGDFVLPRDTTIPLVFVAAGIGITPMLSMLGQMKQDGEKRNLRLIYGVDHIEDLLPLDQYELTDDAIVKLVAHPNKAWEGENSKLSTQLIRQNSDNLQAAYFYISGPEPMVEQFTQELAASGIPTDHIISDYFPGYQAIT